MAELIQLVYASRATFPSTASDSDIEPNVARVLVQSRINNPKRGLVGALYFADSHFFQVLEGDADAVDTLHERLGHDPRHRDIKVLVRRPISQRSFTTWSMKYVQVTPDIRRLLQLHRLGSFDPYLFNGELTEQIVELLLKAAQTPVREHESAAAALARQQDNERFERLEKKVKQSMLVSTLSAVTALIALALAALSF